MLSEMIVLVMHNKRLLKIISLYDNIVFDAHFVKLSGNSSHTSHFYSSSSVIYSITSS